MSTYIFDFVYKGDEYGKLHDLRKKVVERKIFFGDSCQVSKIGKERGGTQPDAYHIRELGCWGDYRLTCVRWIRIRFA